MSALAASELPLIEQSPIQGECDRIIELTRGLSANDRFELLSSLERVVLASVNRGYEIALQAVAKSITEKEKMPWAL